MTQFEERIISRTSLKALKECWRRVVGSGKRELVTMIRLSEKYLNKIAAFANAANFNGFADTFSSPEFKVLREMIVQLHHEHLDQDDATGLLVEAFIDFRHGDGESLVEDDAKRKKLGERLKSLIESYPHKYTFRVSLPSFPAYCDQEIQLAPDVYLQMRTRRDLGADTVQMLPEAHGADEAETWLKIDRVGYGSSELESPAVAESISIIKQCNFVLTSREIARATWAAEERHARAELRDHDTGSTYSIALPATLAKHLGQLTPNEDKLTVFDEPKGNALSSLFDVKERQAVTAEEKGKALARVVRAGMKRFFLVRSHPDFERIASAIDWHQDSEHSDNQTVAYLAACIGMEAILGDAENTMQEMSNRLADRFAFRMGGDRKERQERWNQYRGILSLRGDLVHAKAARLTPEGRRKLWEARSMLHELIGHELDVLYTQIGKEAIEAKPL